MADKAGVCMTLGEFQAARGGRRDPREAARRGARDPRKTSRGGQPLSRRLARRLPNAPLRSFPGKGRRARAFRLAGYAVDAAIAQDVPVTEEPYHRQRAMLTIRLATCDRSLEAFQAADNPLDEEFVRDLERVMARTRGELVAIATRNHKASL
jgi:hypothetical protein